MKIPVCLSFISNIKIFIHLWCSLKSLWSPWENHQNVKVVVAQPRQIQTGRAIPVPLKGLPLWFSVWAPEFQIDTPSPLLMYFPSSVLASICNIYKALWNLKMVSIIQDQNVGNSNLILSIVLGGSTLFVPSMFQEWHLEILTSCGQ